MWQLIVYKVHPLDKWWFKVGKLSRCYVLHRDFKFRQCNGLDIGNTNLKSLPIPLPFCRLQSQQVCAVCTANNNLLHPTQFEVECKAFDNNGPQLSVRGQAPTRTLSLQAHTHSVPALRPGTHTHTLVGCGGKKAQRSLGVPGGTGQGMQMIRV